MGIPAVAFEEEAGRLEHLLCSRCKDVVDAPIFVCEVEHLVCSKCLDYVDQSRMRACPAATAAVCTAKWGVRKSGFVQRQLDALKRRCPNRRHGCLYTGVQKVIEEHVEECGFIAMRCECKGTMLKRDWAEHRNKVCPEAPAICERRGYGCSAEFKRKEKAAHDATCQRYRCSYVPQGCQSYGTATIIAQHEATYCGALQARFQALETASTNLRSELNDCRETVRTLKESNTTLQSEINEAREQAADASAQRDIMANASQQSQSAKRKRTKSVTASPLKSRSSQEVHNRKRTRPAESSSQAINDEESGMSSSSDFEMDQQDDRLLALQLVKEEDSGSNTYRQEIAEIKRQLVEKDVEIARLTKALQKVEGDLAANKKKLFAKDDQLEELREELQDKEEGLAFLRARLDTQAELEAPLKQDPEALQAEEDRLLQRSPSRLTSLSHASQQEDVEADDVRDPEGEEGNSSEPAAEDASSEHNETLSTDEPTPPPPPLSSVGETPSPNTVKSKTPQPESKTSAATSRPRIWRVSEQQSKPTLRPSQIVEKPIATSTPASIKPVKKDPYKASAPRTKTASFNISSSEDSDEELPTVEELFRGASQRPFASQRPSVLHSPGKAK